MADFLGMMKQAAQLQSKMQALQAELDTITVDGTAGGGMVTVTLTARGDLKGIKIDESLIKPGEKEIIEDLRETQPRKNVEVAIEPGMSAVGDTQLLRLFLQNLLENAWKFTSKHNHAKIEIGSSETDGKTVFFVKDDGAGFDMAHADMLFAPFQRLHAQTEFPGTGVGLASAQRIIHRHGGTIWAESEVEKGATFYFTL